MRAREGALIVAVALLAGVAGLAARIAIHGPGPLRSSALGQWLEPFWATEDVPGTVTIGARVPSFELAGLDGQTRRLPRTGRPTLINYWATWCPPCREEIPLLVALSRQQEGRIQVLGIALDSATEAQAFLARAAPQFQSLVETPGPGDSSVRLGNKAGVLPYTVLVSADGRLLKRHSGAFASDVELSQWVRDADAQGGAAP